MSDTIFEGKNYKPQLQSRTLTISSQLPFQNRFQTGNDRPPHLSLTLHFNLQIEMPKHKSRSEMGLLNTLKGGT